MEHFYTKEQFGEDWFTYSNLYSEMVKKFPSGSTFVEVGSWKGKSSSFMAVEIASSHKDINFYCVDTWLGSIEHQNNPELPIIFDLFKSNMSPVEKYYTAVRRESLEAAKLFRDKSLDFVFIDASHEYEDVKKDIGAWKPKIKAGGVLAGHDYQHPPIKEAIRYHQLNVEERLKEDCWVYSVI